MPEAIGALAVLGEGALFFCLQEPDTVARFGAFGKYVRSLFSGWATLMSTASLIFLFLPAAFPDKYRWCVWALAALCFVVASFIAYRQKDTQTTARIAELTAELETERARNSAVVRPRIRLREPNALYVKQVDWWKDAGGRIHKVPFLNLRFVNQPVAPQPSAKATDVRAKLRYLNCADSGEEEFLSINGRWADSTEPSKIEPGNSKTHLLATTFSIGEEHSLDIAYYEDRVSPGFYAWNNDNYNHPNWIFWYHALKGSHIRVEIHLQGDWVDERFSCEFVTHHTAETKYFEPIEAVSVDRKDGLNY